MRTNGLDDSPFTSHGSSSTTLLHNLYEKIERQSQGFDLLKSKVDTLETEVNNQRREMQQFKERLSQLVQRVESFKPEKDHGTTFEEFKSEIRCELNKIKDSIVDPKDSIVDPKDENDDHGWKTTTTERLGHHMTESGQVLSSLEEIHSRLDKIESDLSSSQHNVENNSKMVEKNVTLLSDWRNENMESMNRLCKLQDLSVDEVKHLRSKLYDVQDKIHELETSLNDARVHNEFSTSRKSNSFLDNDMNPKVKHSYISISSDEDERHSFTNSNSSDNLDASDHGDSSLGFNELNLDGSDRQREKSQSSGSDLLHSSLNSLTGSEDSLSEI
ncbi:Hypothetical predicted protein [Paramuricea clavata]|uniref:Uncharacterized protein n=2 Tax=Paramuricea clavata TaxID=317549 RepID=A0A6S7GP95_PARCT|nr:Hypothetical predicted protein [Paramuricea clavata]